MKNIEAIVNTAKDSQFIWQMIGKTGVNKYGKRTREQQNDDPQWKKRAKLYRDVLFDITLKNLSVDTHTTGIKSIRS